MHGKQVCARWFVRRTKRPRFHRSLILAVTSSSGRGLTALARFLRSDEFRRVERDDIVSGLGVNGGGKYLGETSEPEAGLVCL